MILLNAGEKIIDIHVKKFSQALWKGIKVFFYNY